MSRDGSKLAGDLDDGKVNRPFLKKIPVNAEVRSKKKQGQTVQRLQISTFWDPNKYLEPSELFGDPKIIWDPLHYLGPPWFIWDPRDKFGNPGTSWYDFGSGIRQSGSGSDLIFWNKVVIFLLFKALIYLTDNQTFWKRRSLQMLLEFSLWIRKVRSSTYMNANE